MISAAVPFDKPQAHQRSACLRNRNRQPDPVKFEDQRQDGKGCHNQYERPYKRDDRRDPSVGQGGKQGRGKDIQPGE